MSKGRMEVVTEVNGDDEASGQWVYAATVSGVVVELAPGVPLGVMGVVVAPPQLHAHPILLSRGTNIAQLPCVC